MAKGTAERLRRMADLERKGARGGGHPATDAEVYALWESNQYS